MLPPECTVVLFATPPEEMYMQPREFTTVLFATPEEWMHMQPLFTVVLLATP